MSTFVAALPMYDWPEVRSETDGRWARLRDALRRQCIIAPEHLARCNADLPPVPGGIRDAAGTLVAPDPATLPPDEFDLDTLWRHPSLLLAQTCWGPMEIGLEQHVQVVLQPQYSAFDGGEGELYSSAILMRRSSPDAPPGMQEGGADRAHHGQPSIPLERLTRKRFAFNGRDSMSGIIALGRDLETMGSGLEIFSELIETGSHRASVLLVAEGRADACAVDCRTWDLIKRHEPVAAAAVNVVGWTAPRKGLPLIAARGLPEPVLHSLRAALAVMPV